MTQTIAALVGPSTLTPILWGIGLVGGLLLFWISRNRDGWEDVTLTAKFGVLVLIALGILAISGSAGPVAVTMLVVLSAVIGTAWMYRISKARESEIEWAWVIGILLLLVAGIIPGLIGIYLYFYTHKDRSKEMSASSPQ